jgi:integrase
MSLCFYTGGQRPYELVASRWCSINWEEATLLVTSEVSKNKRPHLIPLTEKAITILSELHVNSKDSEFIFPRRNDANQHLRTDSFSKAIARFREDNPKFKPFVARDIRRTCKTLMGELGISKEIRDRLQNHALNDVSSKHYDRYNYLPEKKEALRKWESKLSGLTSKVVNGNFRGIKHGFC